MEYGPRRPRQRRNGHFPGSPPFGSVFIGVGEQCLYPPGDLAQAGIACLAIRPAYRASGFVLNVDFTRLQSRLCMSAICANLPLRIAVLDASIGREARLEESAGKARCPA